MNNMKVFYGIESALDLGNILTVSSPAELKKKFWSRPPSVHCIVLEKMGDFMVTNPVCLEALVSDFWNFHAEINALADQLIRAQNYLQFVYSKPETQFEWVCVRSDEITPCNVDLNKGYWRFPIK